MCHMSQPHSPFDQDERPPPSAPVARWAPKRKWSLVALAVTLFALVWVRELVRLPPEVTIGIAVLIVVVWSVLHLALYAPRPAAGPRPKRSDAPRKTSRAYGMAPRARPLGGDLLTGVLIGVWLPSLLPLGAVELTLAVCLLVLLARGAAAIRSDRR